MPATKKLTANFFQEDLVGRRSILVFCIMFFTGVFKRAERQPTVTECFYEKKACPKMLRSICHDHLHLHLSSNKDLFTAILNSTVEVDFT
jgi:hypothetical protein